jgi:hypothetical protein
MAEQRHVASTAEQLSDASLMVKQLRALMRRKSAAETMKYYVRTSGVSEAKRKTND